MPLAEKDPDRQAEKLKSHHGGNAAPAVPTSMAISRPVTPASGWASSND